MLRVNFVCHGNICRSPMAEFIFKDMLKKQGRESEFSVCSMATSSEEIFMGVGNPVYPPAKKILAEHGISCEGKRAIQVKKNDYDKYDLFICMDSNNIRNITRIFGSDLENKVKKLMDYTERKTDVADPWYTGNFTVTYNDICEGLEGFLNSIYT